MDKDLVLSEMIQNNESCKIINSDFGHEVILRPSIVSDSLKNKLSSEDIVLGMDSVNRQISLSNLKTNLYSQCHNINCIAKDKCIFRSLPNGNTNADIMFVNKMPTEYEIGTMTSHSDTCGVFLTLILSKMNISRDSIYCTDMIKCNYQLDEQSFNECIKNYLDKEINYVLPKIIVCNGLSTLKACGKFSILQDLPSNVAYGNIYDVKTSSGVSVKVTAIYDLDTVLKKVGDDYNKCKGELWTQLLSVSKSLQ